LYFADAQFDDQEFRGFIQKIGSAQEEIIKVSLKKEKERQPLKYF